MEKKEKIVKSQKRFKFLNDQSPLYFLETFEHLNKTHYVVSSNSTLYIGYMEKYNFNQIAKNSVNSYLTSFCMHDRLLYFGLKNGSIMHLSLEQIYNQIPCRIIQSVDGKSVLGICLTTGPDQGQKIMYTLNEENSIKSYHQIQDSFKFNGQILLKHNFTRVVSKAILKQPNLPRFMVQLRDFQGYPILLSMNQIQQLINKNKQFQQVLMLRQKFYMEDQRPYKTITALDYDLGKMIVTLGYSDGIVQILDIKRTVVNEQILYVMTPSLKVKLRQNIRSLSIFPDKTYKFVAFVNEYTVSAFNYQEMTNQFTKITNNAAKDRKQITSSKWTKDKYFLIASLSNADRKIKPKLYCIQQDISNLT